MREHLVRIGGASGAWGDSPSAIGQLLGSDIDYLMMDYLAEVTMSLLARARLKDPAAGFVNDFVHYLSPHLVEIERRGVRVTSNAGGVNPQACKRALEEAAAKAGVTLSIAVVSGDDLLPRLAEFHEQAILEWRSKAPIPPNVLTANAYLGAIPIAEAFAKGADIVITGRCVDSALALGILMHEFAWRHSEYDLLAAGSLVGHLLECGPQSTGGLFTDWEEVPGWHDIGYPIAECRSDGTFVLTKPEGTGGLVTPASVGEQVLYEVGDPAAYWLPDVTADFSQVHLEQAGAHRVRVSGARGIAPTSQYKVSATYQDGWRAAGMVSIVGVDAARKAERTAGALVDRARGLLKRHGYQDFSDVLVEVIGAESAYAGKSRVRHSREVIVRIVAQHSEAKALDLFAREFGSAGLSFAQGTTGLIGGRPKVTAVVRLFTFLVDKEQIGSIRVQVGEGLVFGVEVPHHGGPQRPTPAPTYIADDTDVATEEMRLVPLIRVAHARSGDKGDSSNIAILCRRSSYVAHLRKVLTPQVMAAHFSAIVDGPVTRYEAPGLSAFNFVLESALGGGGMASMRLDAQGKAYGQRALEIEVEVPASWLAGATSTAQ